MSLATRSAKLCRTNCHARSLAVCSGSATAWRNATRARYHGYNAAFLIAGESASCLVETGHPKDFPVIEQHINELFARGVPPLKYLFVTHQETPHCGGLGRILKTHPEAMLCGDVSDYHLAFPQYEHRMQWMKEGDEIDLGGRSLMAVEPVIRDLRTTWWGFDTGERVA
jgi:flavorubredoxin